MIIKYEEESFVKFFRAEGLYAELCLNPNSTELLDKLKSEAISGNKWAKLRVIECRLKRFVPSTQAERERSYFELNELGEEGFEIAKLKKAQYLLVDTDVEKDEKKWAKQALKSFENYFGGDAAFILASYYADIGRDKKAKRWLKRASELGHDEARKKLDLLIDESNKRQESPKSKSKKCKITGSSEMLDLLGIKSD